MFYFLDKITYFIRQYKQWWCATHSCHISLRCSQITLNGLSYFPSSLFFGFLFGIHLTEIFPLASLDIVELKNKFLHLNICCMYSYSYCFS